MIEPTTSVSPQGAGTITLTLVDVIDMGSVTLYMYRPSVTANPGYRFVKYRYRDHSSGGEDRWREYIDDTRFSYYYPDPPGKPYGVVEAVAVFESAVENSAINLNLVCEPSGVGVLTGGGTTSGVVGASTTYVVNAYVTAENRGKHRFLYWLDDQNVKHKNRSFSKTFTFKSGYTLQNPEQITFVAHFIPCTGLILRSSSSGIILRGASNTILRDE